jgi:hypothetical protein
MQIYAHFSAKYIYYTCVNASNLEITSSIVPQIVSGSAVVKNVRQSYIIVNRSEIKWNLAVSTESPLQYINKTNYL